MTEKKAERFWEYALNLYAQDAARDALLRLQDRDEADVPLVLWCLWCGAEGRGVSVDEMRQAVDFSNIWRRKTVEPLRTLRRGLKAGISGVDPVLLKAAREKIAMTEQSVERMQMDHLATLGSGEAASSANEVIDRYALVAGLSLDRDDVAVLLDLS